MTLGEKLQKLRKARAWTQEELAEQVGVSRQSLSKWESDGALPDTANIILLADLFGVTTDYLLRDGEEVASADLPHPENAAPPADPPAIHVEAPVVQLTPPSQKSPPAIIVIALTLLIVGVLVWLGIAMMESIHPHEYHAGGKIYTGMAGYIRGNDLELPYYASLASILFGAVTIASYLLLQFTSFGKKNRL